MSTTKFPPDDILESLYKLRIRESDQRKTVPKLYNLEIHQKEAKPDYQRLKAMVTRRIAQNLRSRNFDARNWRIESRAVVKNQREQRRERQWRANGQCSKGDDCSVQHDKQVLEAAVRLGKYLDCGAKSTSKVPVRIHLGDSWHPPQCLFYNPM